ncbi:hypothetical protein AAVH_01423 [Aphelenchoides avenae]|nr:hypothetical protein AAVH_01423 [Aphelenchus avenae]
MAAQQFYSGQIFVEPTFEPQQQYVAPAGTLQLQQLPQHGYAQGAIGPQQQVPLVYSGQGVRYEAAPNIQLQYARFAGGPAFFDASRGVFFDGHLAYVYENPSLGTALSLSPSSTNVVTGLPQGTLILGNGTQGVLEQHRRAIASAYILDNRY